MTAATEVRLDITGMTCAACANRIERKLNRLPGTTASVNFATETAYVAGSGVALPDLIAAVEAAGYGARPAQAQRGEERDGRRLRLRLVVAAALAVPVVLLSMVPALQVGGWQWIVAALAAPVVTWAAWPFHRSAAVNLRHGATTMDTLISIGIIAATVWSAVVAVVGGEPYLEVGVVVTALVLAGRVAEAGARRRSGEALRALLALGAKDAVRLRNGGEERVPVASLVIGDQVVVRPGETVPSDGLVLDGRSAIDAALLTGESVPIEVGPGDRVTGGTIDVGGRLTIELTRVGADTELARLGRLVTQAQDGKAAVQRLADRVSAVFVPVVLGLAVVALIGWLIVGTPAQAIAAAVTTLIIACPCALGLATPTALLAGTGRGAQLGVLIRGPEVLERTRAVDTIVLDKTGTLTTGRMAVQAVVPVGSTAEEELLRLAAAAERDSEHPIGRAIAAAGRGPLRATAFHATAGGGVVAEVLEARVLVGRATWLAAEGIDLGHAAAAVAAIERRGATAAVVAIDGAVAGVIEVADTIRPGAATAVRRLRSLGLEPVLLTGDTAGAAAVVAAATGIERVFAAEAPEGKLARIRALQAEGRTVAMVGDGVNDAAALAAADLGIAMGGGTDAAAAAADLTLIRDDPALIADAVRLSRATLRTIRGNLFWAFAYNAAALPVAMLGLANPVLAGAAMAASSLLVVGNSLRLARLRPLPAAA